MEIAFIFVALIALVILRPGKPCESHKWAEDNNMLRCKECGMRVK